LADETAPAERRRFRFGLRWKILALVGAAVLVVIAIQAVAFNVEAGDILERRVERRATTIASTFGLYLAEAIEHGELDEALAELRGAATDLPDLAFLVLRDEHGAILGEVRNPSLIGAELAPPVPGGAPRRLRVGDGEVIEASTAFEADPEAGPGDVVPAGRRFGSLQVALGFAEIDQETARVDRRTVVVGLIGLAGALAFAFVISGLLASRLERLASIAAGMARGDVSQEIDIGGTDEVALLARAFASLGKSLKELLDDLNAAAGEIEREAAQVLATVTRQSAMANQQAAALNETSATVREIAQTSALATEHADGVIQVTRKAEELSGEGTRAVDENVGGIEKLGNQVRAIAGSITDLSERTLQISDIITTVRDVAEQSNLLALNASIEAAKAGEHGRGFAVVAMEMRNLAEQSKGAAGQVRAILGEIQKGTRNAVVATEEGSRRARETASLAGDTGRTIQGLADAIRESAVAARQIAGNTRQQTVGVEQIVQAITELSTAMNDTVAGTRQIERVASNLNTLAGRLATIVGRYRA
jgi:methyl-accepting chemotaxis protein